MCCGIVTAILKSQIEQLKCAQQQSCIHGMFDNMALYMICLTPCMAVNHNLTHTIDLLSVKRINLFRSNPSLLLASQEYDP